MKKTSMPPLAPLAVLALAEIQAAVEAFNRGETNASAAVDVIVVAIDVYRAATQPRSGAA